MAAPDVSKPTLSALLRTALVVVVWFVSSVAFNIATPVLLQLLPGAEDMTLLEFAVVVPLGALNLALRGMRLWPLRSPAEARQAVLLGALQLFACRTFMFSLQYIPVALAQTIRATNPVWVVLVSKILWNQQFGPLVMSTLAPLVGGFAMAVGADSSSRHHWGLAAAVLSVIGQVCLNMLSKHGLGDGGGSKASDPDATEPSAPEQQAVAACRAARSGPVHPFELQFVSCFFALLGLLPMWLATGGTARLSEHMAGAGVEVQSTMALLALLNGALYFVEQSASFIALGLFPPLTFAVVDTIRRLTIVLVAGFWVGGTPATPAKAVGVTLVMIGGLGYAYAQDLASRSEGMKWHRHIRSAGLSVKTWRRTAMIIPNKNRQTYSEHGDSCAEDSPLDLSFSRQSTTASTPSAVSPFSEADPVSRQASETAFVRW